MVHTSFQQEKHSQQNGKDMMRKFISTAVLCFVLVFNFLYAQTINTISIIPKPVKLQIKEGTFTFNNNTKIWIDQSDELQTLGDLLSGNINSITGLSLFAASKMTREVPNSLIRIKIDSTIQNKEAYRLSIEPDKILINGGSGAGIFYAIQTMLQLFPVESKNEISLPCVDIEDYPRFKWRGMHLDVCRHFFPVEFVKKYIDILAMYKLNTFHWHLTDDQGWRIEIKKYPKLTEIGAWRKETTGDGKPYGGFYTQDQIREVVEYAKQKYITVVPEIEMPGHALAALSAYPEYSCTGGPFEVETTWGVFEDVFCAGNDNTFKFLDDILDEVVNLFPGEYIHIGGDEVPKDRWRKCEKCQARMKTEGLKDEHELQSYFIQRIEKYLNGKGKKIIGWDEILEGGLAPNAAVMSWRGTDGGIAAAKSKHNVVMSPNSHCYFDHYQGLSGEPKAFGGYTPIEKVYLYEPVPEALNEEESKYIIGAQANMWTEYITTSDHVEYMLLPRLCALSEVLWSPKHKKDINDFTKRLSYHYEMFLKKNINFRIPPPNSTAGEYLITDNEKVILSSPISDSKTYYTLDNSEPTINSNLYTEPLEFSDDAALKAKIFLSNGKTSPTSVLNISLIDTTENGLYYKYYEGIWDSIPKFAELRPDKKGKIFKISLDEIRYNEDYFGVYLYGFIQIDEAGEYTFHLTSDDGSILAVNNKILIDNNGLHGSATVSNKIYLESGRIPFKILYFEKDGGQELKVEYEGPEIHRRTIPADKLFFDIY